MRGTRVSTAGLAGAALLLLPAAGIAAPLDARGSVEQVYVTGLKPGAQVTLLDRKGRVVDTQAASALGGLLFRQVKPGRATGSGRRRRSGVGAAAGAHEAVGAAEHRASTTRRSPRAATAT